MIGLENTAHRSWFNRTKHFVVRDRIMILTVILLFLPVILLSGIEYYRSCLCRLDTVRSYHLKFSEDGNQTRPHGKEKKKEKKRKADRNRTI